MVTAALVGRCGLVVLVVVLTAAEVRRTRDVDGGVTATGVLSRERGNLITVCITLY